MNHCKLPFIGPNKCLIHWRLNTRCSCIVRMYVHDTLHLKGHSNQADFLGFLHKSVRHRSSHYISSRSDFDFEFAEIFVIEKRLPDSPSRGVDKNAYRYKCFQTFESINGVSTLQPRLLFGKLAL